jgi:Protein of unknown function (DUF3606)
MADDFSTRGALDPSHVSMNQVRYWTITLGCSQDELAAAIARVGNSANAVRRELARAWGYGTLRPGAIRLAEGGAKAPKK